MGGKAFLSMERGGVERGKAKNLRGGVGKGSKSAGQGGARAGNILRISAD